MRRFLATLLHVPPEGLSPLSRFIVSNGVLYLGLGLLLLVVPMSVHELAFFTSLEGYEPGMVRVTAMLLAIVGWFYIIGGRTGTPSFALATVVDRLLVPLVPVPLAFTGAVPAMSVMPFAILDPVLAVVALGIWVRTDAS